MAHQLTRSLDRPRCSEALILAHVGRPLSRPAKQDETRAAILAAKSCENCSLAQRIFSEEKAAAAPKKFSAFDNQRGPVGLMKRRSPGVRSARVSRGHPGAPNCLPDSALPSPEANHPFKSGASISSASTAARMSASRIKNGYVHKSRYARASSLRRFDQCPRIALFDQQCGDLGGSAPCAPAGNLRGQPSCDRWPPH